jgi:hypothetical protein
MAAVPADLMTRFQNWDAMGRTPQTSFDWKKENWRRHLGEYSVLESLANPIDRTSVTPVFKLICDPASALDAYIASYVWGYAHAGFGPYRAARVIRQNTAPDEGKDFARELHALARIAMRDGGLAAFAHVVAQRRLDKTYFRHWGPAFATKFISFATKASDEVATTPILDSVVARWFANECKDVEPLWLSWHSADSYRRYTECMAGWANELHIEPDEIEQLIFRPELKHKSQT